MVGTTYCTEAVSLPEQRKPAASVIYGYKQTSRRQTEGTSHPFNKTAVMASLMGPMTSLATAFALFYLTRREFPPVKWALNPTRKPRSAFLTIMSDCTMRAHLSWQAGRAAARVHNQAGWLMTTLPSPSSTPDTVPSHRCHRPSGRELPAESQLDLLQPKHVMSSSHSSIEAITAAITFTVYGTSGGLHG